MADSGAKVPWWKFRPEEQRDGALTWRERFNRFSDPKPARSSSAFEDAFGKLFFVLYAIASWLIGIATFLIAWFYAIQQYGVFLGVGLGVFPAAVIGVLAGLLWPAIGLVLWKWPDAATSLLTK